MKRTNGFGFSLLEVLIALLVLAFGIIGIIKFQSELFQSGAVAKQRTIATALAQDRLEEFRGYLNETEYLALADADSTEAVVRDGTAFSRVTSVTANVAPARFMDVQVAVNWVTPKDAQESVVLRSAVAWADPANSLRLLTAPDIVSSSDCPATNVLDRVCVGTAPRTADGETVSVTYTGGGVGTGDWICDEGVWVAPQPSACVANCSGLVQVGNCTGIAPETAIGGIADVRFDAGGGGSATFSCGDNAEWTFVSGGCTSGCNLPWGGDPIAVGESATSYQTRTPTVACGDVAQVRTCLEPGVLDPRFYDIGSCNEPCPLPEAFDEPFLAYGDSVIAFTERVSESCGEGAIRQCGDTGLSGNASAIYPECLPPGCSAFGRPYELGEVITLFREESAENCEEQEELFQCTGVDEQNQFVSLDDGSILVESVYHEVCLSDPCGYTMSIILPKKNDKFCGAAGVPQGTFPSGSSCELASNKKTITCTGTFDLGQDLTFQASPQLDDGACVTKVAQCETIGPCSLSVRNYSRSCIAN